MTMTTKQSKKSQLYALLYEWFATETCNDCQHMLTYRDGDHRHPCAKCECYDKYRICDDEKEDLKEKVKQILDITEK